MVAHSVSLNTPYNEKLRKIVLESEGKYLSNTDPIILGGGRVREYILNGNSSSYPPVERLAELKSYGGRMIGGESFSQGFERGFNDAKHDLIPKGLRKAVRKRVIKEVGGSFLGKVKDMYNKIPAGVRKVLEKKAVEEGVKLFGGSMKDMKHTINKEFHLLSPKNKDIIHKKVMALAKHHMG